MFPFVLNTNIVPAVGLKPEVLGVVPLSLGLHNIIDAGTHSEVPDSATAVACAELF